MRDVVFIPQINVQSFFIRIVDILIRASLPHNKHRDPQFINLK